jgi:hypothetical protein
VGFRPDKDMLNVILTSTGAGRLDVNANGYVVLQSGGLDFISLENITFRGV